jgi:hypothetical protein
MSRKNSAHPFRSFMEAHDKVAMVYFKNSRGCIGNNQM